jgi:glycosyltransferase involved in cell wall biosynthesis
VAAPRPRTTDAAPGRRRATVRAELFAAAGAARPVDPVAEAADDTGRPLLLTVGRLTAQKDYPTLLSALARLATRDPVPLLAIVGAGPLHAELARRIAAERLPAVLLGQRDDVPALLAAADLFVLASSWEARALVLQEAMRAGVPVVATAVGGTPDLVGDDAALVPAGDAAAFADAVAGLLDDADRRVALAAAGRERAASWPDEAAVVGQVLAVYQELSD